MMGHLRTRIRLHSRPLYSIINSLNNRRPNLPQTLKMESKSKRPTCPSCFKPARLCLCSRIRNPGLENSVSVIILQHSFERKHALNSTRIAKLGLKNLTIATVFDVDFEARFLIRLLKPCFESGSGRNGIESSGFDQLLESKETQKLGFESVDGFKFGRENVADLEFKGNVKCSEETNTNLVESNGDYCLGNDLSGGLKKQKSLGNMNAVQNSDILTSDFLDFEPENELSNGKCIGASSFAMEAACKHLAARKSDLDTGSAFTSINESIPSEKTNSSSCTKKIWQPGYPPNGDVPGDTEEQVITATIGKHGIISELAHISMQQMNGKKINFDQFLSSHAAMDALAKGFVVKKLHKRQLNGSMDLDEYEEFQIKVPPGSVLLFPSEAAISVVDLEAIGFKVKNLIVLDGTWAKAKRMYAENPWLKLLPHLRLDLDAMSLYSEVRHQPKAGYLSTIESIVYAMKAVGNYPEGLDKLLDVFESMVEDQRRCKNERLSKVSQKEVGNHSHVGWHSQPLEED